MFRYHIKYMYVGDGVKSEVEKVIRKLRPALRLRLRFISHQGKEETTPSWGDNATDVITMPERVLYIHVKINSNCCENYMPDKVYVNK